MDDLLMICCWLWWWWDDYGMWLNFPVGWSSKGWPYWNNRLRIYSFIPRKRNCSLIFVCIFEFIKTHKVGSTTTKLIKWKPIMVLRENIPSTRSSFSFLAFKFEGTRWSCGRIVNATIFGRSFFIHFIIWFQSQRHFASMYGALAVGLTVPVRVNVPAEEYASMKKCVFCDREWCVSINWL